VQAVISLSRIRLGLVLLLAVIWLASCDVRRKGPSSAVDMADPSAAAQLVEGFYGQESNRWRWTAEHFSVLLEPPPGTDETGAYLRLKFFIPDEEIQKTGSLTLSADVESVSLSPETIEKGGFFIYSRQVPAAALQSNLVKIAFTFDKAYLPGNGDARRLGAVVERISLNRN